MNFGRLLAGNIVYRLFNVFAGILIAILLTRLMSAGGYGVLSLLIVNASIFNLASCLGAESGITYHFASNSIRKGKIFSIIYFVILFQLILLGLIEFIHFSITWRCWLTGGNEIGFVVWGIIYLFSITLIDKYTAFMNGSHLYTLANKIIFYTNLATVLVFGWFYFFYEKQGIGFYIHLFIGASFLQAIMLIFFYHRDSKQRLIFLAIEKNDWVLFFSYSFIVFITNILQFLAYRIDYWLVDFYRGIESLGLYSLAVRLCQLFWVLPVLFASILFPRVADKEMEPDSTKLLLLLRCSNTFSLIAIFITAALAGWGIPLFFGKEFNSSVLPFLYLLPGIFMFGINILLAAYFAGKNRLSINLTGSAICFVLVLLLDLWLIPLHGVVGAAIASSIAYAVAAVYSMWMFMRIRREPLSSLLFLQKKDWLQVKEVYKKMFG